MANGAVDAVGQRKLVEEALLVLVVNFRNVRMGVCFVRDLDVDE